MSCAIPRQRLNSLNVLIEFIEKENLQLLFLNRSCPDNGYIFQLQTVHLGKNVALRCRSMGNSVPTISGTQKKTMSEVEVNFILVQQDSATEDDIKYTAQNGTGCRATARTYLDAAA